MGGKPSKTTDELHQNLARSDTNVEVVIDLNKINFRVAFQSLPFNDLIEFTDLRLETDDEAAKIMIECKKKTWRNKRLSNTFQDYFNITSKLLKSSKQLLSTTGVNRQEEEGQQLNNPFGEYFIKEYQSLEGKLLAHNANINPNRRMYSKLRVVARTLMMVPFLGPVTLTSIFGGRPHPAPVATLVTSAFVACGATGRWGVFFCESEMKALKVQEEVIGLMLISIEFQSEALKDICRHLGKGLSMQDDGVNKIICKLQGRLKIERKIILQKLSEYENAAEDNTFEKRV